MTLLAVWLHLAGIVVWIGGLSYQVHVLRPLVARDPRLLADAAGRARPVTWTAIAVVALTGFYNVTQLGPLERVMASGVGVTLAAKFVLVLVAITLASQRDFAQVPRLRRAVVAGENSLAIANIIAWLDRLVLVLALVIMYLGLRIARA